MDIGTPADGNAMPVFIGQLRINGQKCFYKFAVFIHIMRFVPVPFIDRKPCPCGGSLKAGPHLLRCPANRESDIKAPLKAAFFKGKNAENESQRTGFLIGSRNSERRTVRLAKSEYFR